MNVATCASCGAARGECAHTRTNVVADGPKAAATQQPASTYVPGQRDYTKTVGRADALEPRVAAIEHRLYEISQLGGIPGPRGEAGRDGIDSKNEVIDQLQQFVGEQLGAFRLALRKICLEELIRTGVLDSSGKAVPGPQGAPGREGKDSTVPGPAGYTPRKGVDYFDGAPGPAGQSIVGPAGRDGKDSTVPGPAGRDGVDGKDSTVPGPKGNPGRDADPARVVVGRVVSGDSASATIRLEEGTHYLDLVLPRGEVGPVGPRGNVGLQGRPGDISAAIGMVEQFLGDQASNYLGSVTAEGVVEQAVEKYLAKRLAKESA